MMGIDRPVNYELRDGIAWVGLNRPGKRNAINEALLAEFDLAVRRGQEDARVMVVSVTARVSQPVSTLSSTALDSHSRSTTPHAPGMRRSRHYGMVVFR